jgi:dolichyl-phosphate beta-glucosyltransferase
MTSKGELMYSDATKRPVISVVIPAYNEEDRLPVSLERIYRYLSRRSFEFEIIVVDDCSTDRTFEITKRFCRSKRVGRILRNSENRGKGFSVKRGILEAKGEYILFSDADLSTPIEELDRLMQPITHGNCDIAIASRAHQDSDIRVFQPWYRSTMGNIFNVFVQILAVKGFRDTQCGFKCFKRCAAMRTFRQQQLTGFGFDVEILYIAQKAGYVIQEFPVTWINSPDSRVHVIADSARMLFDLWRIRLNDWRGLYENQLKQTASTCEAKEVG